MKQKVMRVGEVLDAIGLQKSAFYGLIRSGQFPKPIRLSIRAVGWLQSEVEAWIEARAAAREVRHG